MQYIPANNLFTALLARAVDANNKPLEQHAKDIVAALAAADSEATRDAQAKPENQWACHPLVDGCAPDDDAPSLR